MNFEVGETVVYPHHGAATIEEVEMRTFKGEEKTYLTLRVSEGDLTIKVPAKNVDLVGVRDVVDEEGLQKVFDLLRTEHTEEPPPTGHVGIRRMLRSSPPAPSTSSLKWFVTCGAARTTVASPPARSGCSPRLGAS